MSDAEGRLIAIIPNGVTVSDAVRVMRAIESAYPGATIRGGEHGFEALTTLPIPYDDE